MLGQRYSSWVIHQRVDQVPTLHRWKSIIIIRFFIYMNRQMCIWVFLLFQVLASYNYTQLEIAPGDELRSIDIAPSKTKLVVGSTTPFIKEYSLDTLTQLSSYTPIGTPVSLRYSPNEQYIVGSGFSNHHILVLQGGTASYITTATDTSINEVSFDPTSSYILSCGDVNINIWDVSSLTLVRGIPVASPVRKCKYSDDNFIGVGYQNGSVEIYDIYLNLEYFVDKDPHAVFNVHFAPMSHTIAFMMSSDNGWVMDEDENIIDLGYCFANPRAGAYAPDMIGFGGDGGVQLYNATTYAKLDLLTQAINQVQDMDFTDDGTHLAVAALNGYLYLYYIVSQPSNQTISILGCLSYNNSQCIQCMQGYYLQDGSCEGCWDAMNGCALCENNSTCSYCLPGYTQYNNTCSVCSGGEGCTICNSEGCISCAPTYYLSNATCISCEIIPRCVSCLSENHCIECHRGYYANEACYECPQHCLTCASSAACTACSSVYYQHNGGCVLCPDGCTSCQSDSMCHTCAQHYSLLNHMCVYTHTYTTSTITFITYYVNTTTLLHVIHVSDTFTHTTENLSPYITISVYNGDGEYSALSIQHLEWGQNSKMVNVYTNNIINIDIADMQVIQQGRVLSQLYALEQSTVMTILPHALSFFTQQHQQALQLSYQLSGPQFVGSYMLMNDAYFYYIFGIVVLVSALGLFVWRSCERKRAQVHIISHIQAYKCGAFISYPIHIEWYNWCWGWVVGDFPWLNRIMGGLVGDASDTVPLPYSLFYLNLNIASTFFLPFMFLLLLMLLLPLLMHCCTNKSTKQSIKRVYEGLYMYFMFGLCMASCASLQGFILNPSSQFDANIFFYLLGALLYFVLLAYTVYLGVGDGYGHYRVLIKGSLLSLCYMSPIFVVLLVVSIDLMISYKQYTRQKQQCPKVWLSQQIIINIGLILEVILYSSILGIILCCITISSVLCIEVYLTYQVAQSNSQTGEQKKKQVDPTFITHETINSVDENSVVE